MFKRPLINFVVNVRHFCLPQVEPLQQTAKLQRIKVVSQHDENNLTSIPYKKNVNHNISDQDDFSDDISFPPIKRSVLEECNEEVPAVGPISKPSFNFAAYVNKSHTLEELVKLGVDLHKIEKRGNDLSYILQLDFEKDIKNHILFLSEVGVSNDDLGEFITKNPFIFQEDLENLQVRVNYLRSKLFSDQMIARIITRSPYWLMFSTPRIDQKLGYFQKTFKLTGYDVRNLASKQPKLITYSITKLKASYFTVKEEMGFLHEEVKSILLKQPNIFMKNPSNMLKTFEIVHRDMNIPLERIAEYPGILTCRDFKVKQRHLYLKMLGRDQYNRREPNYVSLQALISGTDTQFCSEVAKTSVDAFNTFLKSL